MYRRQLEKLHRVLIRDLQRTPRLGDYLVEALQQPVLAGVCLEVEVQAIYSEEGAPQPPPHRARVEVCSEERVIQGQVVEYLAVGQQGPIHLPRQNRTRYLAVGQQPLQVPLEVVEASLAVLRRQAIKVEPLQLNLQLPVVSGRNSTMHLNSLPRYFQSFRILRPLHQLLLLVSHSFSIRSCVMVYM